MSKVQLSKQLIGNCGESNAKYEIFIVQLILLKVNEFPKNKCHNDKGTLFFITLAVPAKIF